jgi:4-oxalomesaconate hydratase
MTKKLLVIGAHSADFLWRAGGIIALTVSQGGSASVVALSYGEQGESGDLWKEPKQTVDNVKRIRHQQASDAAGILGADFHCLDLGDYPLSITEDSIQKLVGLFRELKPEIVITHTPLDPFNPDHPAACQAVQKARLLAIGAGVASAFDRITPPQLYFFEPHQPELCNFTPNTFVDITTVFEQKQEAMKVVKAQSYMQDYYSELASRRGNHARRISGMGEVKYAEAFERTLPWVVKSL